MRLNLSPLCLCVFTYMYMARGLAFIRLLPGEGGIPVPWPSK